MGGVRGARISEGRADQSTTKSRMAGVIRKINALPFVGFATRPQHLHAGDSAGGVRRSRLAIGWIPSLISVVTLEFVCASIPLIAQALKLGDDFRSEIRDPSA